MSTITNSTGIFRVDDEGVLRGFECTQTDGFRFPEDPDCRGEKCLCGLEIPEGITVLPAGAFDGYQILDHITLPETLTALGDASGGVFRHCRLPGTLNLPGGITFVGEDSFFLSTIPGTIRISEEMEAHTAQRLVHLFRNHTYHYFLFYPVEKVRDLPPVQVPVIPLRNASGTFFVNKMGVLQDFSCAEENNADSCSVQKTKKLYTLQIPEGVTVLKEEAFRDYTVLDKLTLPSSLGILGTGHGCAFANCSLPDVVLPPTLQILGTFSFGHTCMRSLRLPADARWEYARQFKSGVIGTLYLSRKLRDDSGAGCSLVAGGYLQSLYVNDVDIRELVWLE